MSIKKTIIIAVTVVAVGALVGCKTKEKAIIGQEQLKAVSADDSPRIDNLPESFRFQQKIDSLRQIIPTVTGNQIFSFKELSADKDVFKWHEHNSQRFTKIDSITWYMFFVDTTKIRSHDEYGNKYNSADYIRKYKYVKHFSNWGSYYYYKEFDFKDNLFNLVFLEYTNDSNKRSHIYLVQFDKQGNPQKSHILATIWVSADEYEEVYSEIQKNKIITYSYYQDDSDGRVEKDTTETLW
jgi:hypothetical protein